MSFLYWVSSYGRISLQTSKLTVTMMSVSCYISILYELHSLTEATMSYTSITWYIIYASLIQLGIGLFIQSISPKCRIHRSSSMQNHRHASTSISLSSSKDDYDIDWSSLPDFQSNIPLTKRKTEDSKKTEKEPAASAIKPLKKPNADWRAAMMKPSKESFISSVTKGKVSTESISAKRTAPIDDLRSTEVKRPLVRDDIDIDISDDFDYEDFESAMREEETMYGSGSTVGVKRSIDPPSSASNDFYDMPGLETGDIISKTIWNTLTDVNGKPYDFDRLDQLAGLYDIMIVYADPRRMNDDFRSVLGYDQASSISFIVCLYVVIDVDELKKLPLPAMKASIVAVNCADVADNRKFQKKTAITIPLLSDSTKKVTFLIILPLSTTLKIV